ncbi:secretin N-terminal domain-containing protein [Thioalkalivibrio sp. ALJ16]|uniref:secretin N-terminal domain-containing protein n=1 Tax=Thioalkalivibrio sp. ALJ16 TaxID=1158762 RepID=UPI00036A4873|nr:secretin N-terminal domain-containing protein [Thioalkalivibrio sp. ALJ16]
MSTPGRNPPPPRRRLLRVLAAAGAALVLPVAARARDPHAEVAVLPLRNRPAGEILDELQALFGDTATLRADGFRLLVRADAATMQQIRALVAELDHPARDLLLSVRRSAEAPGREHGTGIDLETGPAGTRARGTVSRRITTRREDLTQQLRLREGTSATILVGETEPAGFRLIAGRAGVGVEPLVQDTTRGFRVRPQLQPDGRVRVEIEQLHERPAPGGPGRIDRQALTTAITLEPGRWHPVAGVEQTLEFDTRGLASRRTTRDRDHFTLELRVTPID